MPNINYEVNANYFQSSDESCWYAAYCMLFDWKGIPITAIRNRMEKAGLNYADFWNHGLPTEKYNDVRWNLGLSGYRRAYFSQIVDDLDFLAKNLTDYGPFWVAFSVPGEHIVVVHGIEGDKIKVMNPSRNGYGTAKPEKYTIGEFKRRLGSADIRSAAQMWIS